MQRRDFEDLANAIRNASMHLVCHGRPAGVSQDTANEIIGAFVDHVAEILRETNRWYDVDRFLAQCGYPRPEELSADELAMKDMYEAGATLAEVGERFGLTAPTVSRWLQGMGVAIRRPGPRGPRRPRLSARERR